MSVAWVLRHASMVSVAMGASRPEQVAQNVASLSKLQFSAEELSRIDALTRSRSAR
jgi:L-glyceraldehyde 3-phosphate reductase